MSAPSHAGQAEQPVLIEVEGCRCVALLHPSAPSAVGVVLVVGGPQYRVGSHRQFVLLARALAAGGVPVLRFDYRGLGDSEGELRDFQDIDADIRVAIDTLVAHSDVQRVVLWGLCDAASAIMMYAHRDARVSGLVLLNPWVHTVAGEAKVRMKTYYWNRLTGADFWRKLARMEVDWAGSAASLWQNLKRMLPSAARAGEDAPLDFIERMRRGWRDFPGPSLVLLSGDDLTAGEFTQLCADNPAWRQLFEAARVTTRRLPDANHTFARAEWRAQVERFTLEWIREQAGR